MEPRFKRARVWLSSLRPRAIVFVTLALLPIGLIAIYQSNTVAEEVRLRSELSLLALTERAARQERQLIERGFGAARGLSVAVQQMRGDPQACSAMLADFLRDSPFSFISFIVQGELSTCNSAGEALDLDDRDTIQQMFRNPAPRVDLIHGRVSDEQVLILLQPVMQDNAVLGVMTMSLPVRIFDQLNEIDLERRPLGLVLFNADGNVLASRISAGSSEGSVLPADRALSALTVERPVSFTAPNRQGYDRHFAVVPIVPDTIYALSAWNQESVLAMAGLEAIGPSVIALLMWLASLVTVYFAMHRLVIRHVHTIAQQVRAFGTSRVIPDARRDETMPAELREIDEEVRRMAWRLLEDEAKMENALHEKSVLLKEVHHRVKNNLQLISSIVSMQVRKMPADEETRALMRRLQDRVLALAAIHRRLYQTENISQVETAPLLADLLRQAIMGHGLTDDDICLETEFENIALYPDQAVPLSLLVAEAANNAIKFGGPPPDGLPWLRVSFQRIGEEDAELVMSNSVAKVPEEENGGLGTQLIRAFALQLGGDCEVKADGASFTLSLRFPVQAFEHAPRDF